MRLEKVFIKGDATGNTTVAGLATTFRISKSYGVEVEVTQAAGRIERSYDGTFISYYQGTDSSRENILSIPAEVDPARVARDTNFSGSSFSGTRGGLLFGLGSTIALTDHISVAPEVRFVYGGPAQIGSKHREAGFGLRGMWRF